MRFVLFCILMLTSQLLKADSLRCGNRIVKTGDTKAEVKLVCGQPFETEYTANQRVGNKVFKIERYFYLQGSGKLMKILEFRNGKLYSVSNGPRQQ